MILVILPEKYLKVAFIPVSKARLEIEADTCLNDIYHAKEELHNAATDIIKIESIRIILLLVRFVIVVNLDMLEWLL